MTLPSTDSEPSSQRVLGSISDRPGETDDGPVRQIAQEDHPQLVEGIGLCLSGGGYRAMLFHVGAVLRLNELGVLTKLDRVSSVSGGSITAALLGQHWSALQAADWDPAEVFRLFVKPIRDLASRSIDTTAIVAGTLLPGAVSERIEAAYQRHLFGDATLQDLPDTPRFVINATNVQSMALWRFSKPHMADYRVGLVRKPQIKLAKAVAASSAFPPVLSPVEIELNPDDFDQATFEDLHSEPYTSRVVLTDGGVYDNLGLETVWKRYRTVLVSDGGGKTPPQPEPKRDWIRHIVRILFIIDNQVRSMRLRQIMDAFEHKSRNGAYWGIRTAINDYRLVDALSCPATNTRELAEFETRLRRVDPSIQERLINWGYAVCDAAVRKYAPETVTTLIAPKFPYPDRAV